MSSSRFQTLKEASEKQRNTLHWKDERKQRRTNAKIIKPFLLYTLLALLSQHCSLSSPRKRVSMGGKFYRCSFMSSSPRTFLSLLSICFSRFKNDLLGLKSCTNKNIFHTGRDKAKNRKKECQHEEGQSVGEDFQQDLSVPLKVIFAYVEFVSASRAVS